jgi:hypothetical protein
MEYGHVIRACIDVWKLADGVSGGDRGLGMEQGFSAVFWEAVSGRVAHTTCPLQPSNFYIGQVRWRRLDLVQGARPERQLVCARRLAINRGQGAAAVWRNNRRNHPQEKKLVNSFKLSREAVDLAAARLGEDITPVVPWV